MKLNEGINIYEITNGLSTIFLSGAPGSGKTEFLDTVLDSEKFIIIDIDKYRKYFEGYNGKNSSLYQESCSRVATKIFNYCIKKNLKVIFDGTLTSSIGLQNISKSIKKNRNVGIVLIYQDPIISYAYTKVRQDNNERNVDIETFIKIYYSSIKYTFKALDKYKDIGFVIASKNKNREWKQLASIGMRNKEKFDNYFNIEYNKEKLIEKLKELLKKEYFKNIKKILGIQEKD